ncbi:MAG: ribosome-associated translation inhibitor RaiA [Acidobacteria bacterium]|nr:MAG: ribosome-associated translation inhibitor RaiA [Acidobacteriota bacterium]
MNIEYTGRHFRVRDDLRGFTEKKLQKVAKFIEEPIEIRVLLEADKHRRIAEIHVSHRHGVLQATEEAEHMEDAINAAVDKVEKQARRARKKFMDVRRRAQRAVEEEQHWPLEVLARDSVSPGDGGPRVIKTTRLQIKPMTIEEAALQLSASKNDFFVFRDSRTDRVSVLYRRRDNNYGLITPEP